RENFCISDAGPGDAGSDEHGNRAQVFHGILPDLGLGAVLYLTPEVKHMHGLTDTAERVIGVAIFATIWLAAPTTLTAQVSGSEARRFELRIENARVADDLKTIRIQRGDSVELVWSADRHTVLHLHGYEVEVTVDPGETRTMKFRARATGRFPVEVHEQQHK